MGEIALVNGGVALVDEDAYERLGHLRWRLHSNGYVRWQRSRGPRGNVEVETRYLHREVLGLSAGDPRWVDHINRDRLDCRRENLRVLEPGVSNQNTSSRKGSSSKWRGVSWREDKRKWEARAQVAGRCHRAGYFDSEEDAGRAAAQLRQRHLPFSRD